MYVRASVAALALISSAAFAQPNKMAAPHTAPTPAQPKAAAAETAAKPTAVTQTVSTPATPEDRAAALKKRIADAIAAGDCDIAKELAMRGGDAKTMADTDAACKAK